MATLFIDTSREESTIVLIEKGSLLELKSWAGNRRESEKLLPEIEALLLRNKLEVRDLMKIIVVVGPGGYTGLRVGVVVANALAVSLNIPLAGITNPQLLAKRFQKTKNMNKLFIQWPLNRGYFFVQGYKKALSGSLEGEVVEGDFSLPKDLKLLEKALLELDRELKGNLETVQPFYAIVPALSSPKAN